MLLLYQCFNSAKSWQTGWYGENGVHGDKTLETSLSHGCLETSLSGIADYDTTSNLVLIKIVNPANDGADFFVAFNAKKGINRETQETGDKVTVVQVPSGGGMNYATSEFLRELSAGEKYTNDVFTVEVESITGSDFANVKIYSGPTCALTTPAPSPAPTSGQYYKFASYDASLGAPRCSSFGSACDSQGLLNGKGNMSGGNEPNQPNTLNSACADGHMGTYHSDESVDKIVVSHASGNARIMTEGDTVTITATVWCYDPATKVDFHYTSDASNPVWTQIGERRSCPGTGHLTFTAEYTLPEGEIQAVRVNSMFNDQPIEPGEGCTGGGGIPYTDVDDLVFSVKAIQPTYPPSPQSPPPTSNPTPVPSNAPTQSPTNQVSGSTGNNYSCLVSFYSPLNLTFIPTSSTFVAYYSTIQESNKPTDCAANEPSNSVAFQCSKQESNEPSNSIALKCSEQESNKSSYSAAFEESNEPSNSIAFKCSKQESNEPSNSVAFEESNEPSNSIAFKCSKQESDESSNSVAFEKSHKSSYNKTADACSVRSSIHKQTNRGSDSAAFQKSNEEPNF